MVLFAGTCLCWSVTHVVLLAGDVNHENELENVENVQKNYFSEKK